MGMAASQARYLALTARKSNCEYEGQQINQARTALSNQSANLFNQMLGLSVPVPPSTQDFTKTQYSYSDGINSSVIDEWNQISNADPDYNYVVTHHYYTDVYTGSQKKLNDPQVQFNSNSSINSLEQIREATELINTTYQAYIEAKAKETNQDTINKTIRDVAIVNAEGVRQDAYKNADISFYNNMEELLVPNDATTDNLYDFVVDENGNYVRNLNRYMQNATFVNFTDVREVDNTYEVDHGGATSVLIKWEDFASFSLPITQDSMNEVDDFLDNIIACNMNIDPEIMEHISANPRDYSDLYFNIKTIYSSTPYTAEISDIVFKKDLEAAKDGTSSVLPTVMLNDSGGINDRVELETNTINSRINARNDAYDAADSAYETSIQDAEDAYNAAMAPFIQSTEDAYNVYQDALDAYEALNVPKYVGNSPLTYLTDLTSDQQAELRQIMSDMQAQGINDSIKDCFDADGNYLGGIYTFKMNGATYFTTYDDLYGSYTSGTGHNQIDGQTKLAYYNASYISTKIEKTEKALLETDQNGRFSSVRFESDSATYTLKSETITDEAAYEDAMNQYIYNNALYDKTIQDINAKTSIIQRQDQQLELRLKQLDTEQKALSNEMDAVQKVISSNVESTFKTFGG